MTVTATIRMSPRFVSPPTRASAYSAHASRIPPYSSITHAASTWGDSAIDTSAERGLPPIAAMSDTFTVTDFAPRSRGEIVDRSKCTPSTSMSVVTTSWPVLAASTAASSPRPTTTSRASPARSRVIAATSSSSVRSMAATARFCSIGRRAFCRIDGLSCVAALAPTAEGDVRLLVQARTVHQGPTPEELRDYTERMPACRITEFGSVNVQARVTSRSAGSTYVVAELSSGKTMTREEFERIAAMQDEYLRGRDALVIDGYIGNDPEFRTRARLSIETANANIVGMQQKLYFPREDDDEPEVHVVYTPNLSAPGYPDDRVIAVDIENGLTRVIGTDYFGESKKGGLRMWNTKVYDLGGLALHAGMKVIPTARGERVFMIIGLSGTGKTTTTFTTQNDSLPVQDDFVALMPRG